MNFDYLTTPDGRKVKYGAFTIGWLDENGKRDPASEHMTYIVVDRLSEQIAKIVEDYDHAAHEMWTRWDEQVFYYCDDESELRRIIDEGTGDGWYIRMEGKGESE